MTELLKEDLMRILTKKRFLIPAVLTFVVALVMAAITKVKHWNDLTFFFGMQNFLLHGFNTVAGVALLIGVYCRHYTKTSIELVEEKGVGRTGGVLSRFLTGAGLLAGLYGLMFVWILILGLLFGAHLTGSEIGALALKMGFDLTAAVASYSGALFFLYLFGIPPFSIIWYVIMMYVPEFLFLRYKIYSIPGFQTYEYLVPKATADLAYTRALFSDTGVISFAAFLAQTAVPFLLSCLVFKLKKKERKPRKSKKKETLQETVEAVTENATAPAID